MSRKHGHLSWSHPLAAVAAQHCRAHGVSPVLGIGQVACGACWELAIRDDERIVVEHGLPREIVPDPWYIDEIAVERAVRGEPVRLTPAERREAVARMTRHGATVSEIARTLRMSGTDARLAAA